MANWKKIITSGSLVTQLDFAGSQLRSGSDFTAAGVLASLSGSGIVSSSAQTLAFLSGSSIVSSSAQTMAFFSGSGFVSSSTQTLAHLSGSGIVSSSTQTLAFLSGSSIVSSSAQTLAFLSGSNIVSSSAQSLAFLSGSNIVSSSAQSLAFLSGSGVFSSSAEGTGQGQIKFNNVDYNVKDMGSDDSPQFGSLTLTGDLTVQGTTTTINTAQLSVSESMIFLASGSEDANVDAGILVQSGSTKDSGSALFHDTSAQRWAVGKQIGVNDYVSATSNNGFVVTVKSISLGGVAPYAGGSDGTAVSTSLDGTSTSASYGVGEIIIDSSNSDIWILGS